MQNPKTRNHEMVDTGYSVHCVGYDAEGVFTPVCDHAFKLDPKDMLSVRYSPEYAAQEYAANWCQEGADYEIIEREGLLLRVRDPDGNIHMIIVRGEFEFVFQIEAVDLD